MFGRLYDPTCHFRGGNPDVVAASVATAAAADCLEVGVVAYVIAVAVAGSIECTLEDTGSSLISFAAATRSGREEPSRTRSSPSRSPVCHYWNLAGYLCCGSSDLGECCSYSARSALYRHHPLSVYLREEQHLGMVMTLRAHERRMNVEWSHRNHVLAGRVRLSPS